MAKLVYNDKEIAVRDGSPIKDACAELGVSFGCDQGICGVCIIEIVEGMENLSPLAQAEKDMGLQPNQRLACQCSIKKGTVKFNY